METAYEYVVNERNALVSSDEPKVIRRVEELARKFPEEVLIQRSPKENHGVLVARVPRTWIKLPTPPRSLNLSDEQREAVKNRLRNAREQRKTSSILDEDESDE